MPSVWIGFTLWRYQWIQTLNRTSNALQEVAVSSVEQAVQTELVEIASETVAVVAAVSVVSYIISLTQSFLRGSIIYWVYIIILAWFLTGILSFLSGSTTGGCSLCGIVSQV